jgi:polar amino acid transport system substrate-binding protein
MPYLRRQLSVTIPRPARSRLARWPWALLALVLAVSACSSVGGSSPGSASSPKAGGVPSATYDPAAFKLLPASVRASKSVTDDVDVPIPPWTVYSSANVVTGPVADLQAAIAKTLGIKFQTHDSTSTATTADIQANRVDLAFGVNGDNPDREKTASFLDVVLNPQALLTKQGNPYRISDLASICGLGIATDVGSAAIPLLQQVSAQYCTSQGKSAVKIQTYSAISGEAPAVQSGQSQALIQTLAQEQAIAAAAPTTFQVVLTKLPNGLSLLPAGLEFPAGSGLIPAFKRAFTDIMSNGVYQAILARYGLSAAALRKPVVNLATTQPALAAAVPPLTG